MSAIGHLIGYAIGTLDLRSIWGDFLGDTQFKQLCVIAGLALLFAQSVSSYCVKERILISSGYGSAPYRARPCSFVADQIVSGPSKSGPLEAIAKIFRMTVNLPPRIRAICWVQFWAWIGWFPFLFYSPTWVGETYFRYSAHPSSTSEDKLGELGRIGSLSLVIFSAITLVASILLPFLIRSPDRTNTPRFTPRPAAFLRPLLSRLPNLEKNKPDLLTAWLMSHFLFAGAMLLTPLVRSTRFATLLVSVSGLPWALAGWAPFAFMGVEINKLTLTPAMNGHARMHSLSASFAGPGDVPGSPTLLRLNHGQGVLGKEEISDSEDEAEEGGLLAGGMDKDAKEAFASTGETAGIYLGILNLYTTLPQFVGTFISMIVFAIFEEGSGGGEFGSDGKGQGAGGEAGMPEGDVPVSKDKGGVNAIAVCLFIGGVCSLVAAYATSRLKATKQAW